MVLKGLPNTRYVRACKFFRSPTAAIRILRKGLAATSSGSNGAINVWKDRDGKYRCEAMRFKMTTNSTLFSSQSGVRNWLAFWLRQIQ